MGVATPDTNPGTPDGKVFYIALDSGIYTSFGGVELIENEGFLILYFDTSWKFKKTKSYNFKWLNTEKEIGIEHGYIDKNTLEFVSIQTTDLKTYAVDQSRRYTAIGATGNNGAGIAYYENDDIISIEVKEANTTFVQFLNLPENCNKVKVLGTPRYPAMLSSVNSKSFSNWPLLSPSYLSILNKSNIDYILDNDGYYVSSLVNPLEILPGFYNKSTFKFTAFDGFYTYIYDVNLLKAYNMVYSGVTGNSAAGFVYLKADKSVISAENTDANTVFSGLKITNTDIPDECVYVGVSGTNAIIPTLASVAKQYLTKQNSLEAYLYSLKASIKSLQNGDTNNIKLLIVGNSFSRDAFSYVPYILKNINPSLNIKIGIAYIGSASLQTIYNAIVNNTSFVYSESDGISKWVNHNLTFNQMIALNNWDVITFQQNSTNSVNYSTFQPYLNNILTEVFNRVGRAVKIGWILTHAYSDTHAQDFFSYDSNQMFNNEIDAIQSMLGEVPIDLIFPYGAAIQRARQTSLNSIGDNLCYTDGIHLNEGLPCQIAAYTNILVILDLIFKKQGIYADAFRVTQNFVDNMAIPETHGTVIGVTDENVMIGQQCAIMAFKNPFFKFD